MLAPANGVDLAVDSHAVYWADITYPPDGGAFTGAIIKVPVGGGAARRQS